MMPIATFKAKSKLVEGLQVDNTIRNFMIRMDEPVTLGGTDTGMNPVEALLAALGSCLTIVAGAFAEAHDIDLEEFWVELEGDLDPDGFLRGVEGVRNGFQEVRFKPHLKTSASKEKVLEFVNFIKSRCPVSDNLINETKVITVDPVIE
jgi:uncharacterized OsmC-like protein